MRTVYQGNSMNKKNVSRFMAINIVGSLLLSQSALAGISSKRASGTNTSSSSGGSSGPRPIPTQSQKEDYQQHTGTSSMGCNGDAGASEYLPLDFFKEITRDGTLPTFEQSGDNKIVVKMPMVLDGCGSFNPLIIQSKGAASDVVVAMTINNNQEYETVPPSDKKIKGNTYAGLLRCLESKGYLKDGVIDHAARVGADYRSYSSVVDYDFSKEKDAKQTIKLSYGAPIVFEGGSDSYPKEFGIDPDVKVPASKCMQGQKLASDSIYLNKGQDVLLQELTAICTKGSAQQIADARRSIGNADALRDIADKLRAELDGGYLIAVQKDVERIMSAMDKLENQINKEKDTMDEKTAKNIAKKYADLAKEFDTLYLNPAIKHLGDLMTQRADMEEGDARDKVDEEIKLLNQNIGKFSSRNQTAFANLYGLMEKYALTDSAKNIEDIRLKSYVYSRVFMGSATDKRGKPMTLEQANQKQISVLQSFERTLGDWTDQYLVGQGNLYPIKKTEKERQAVVNKMNTRWQKYQQDEQTTYNKYCTGIFGASNPVRCRDFMKGAEQRRATEVKKWQKDNQVVTSRNAKLERMGGNYNAYLQATAEQRSHEADSYNPWGSSYTSFDDNFGDQYPSYQAPTAASSGYEAWRYSMGAQPGMQAGMMGGMQSPMMYNPQMPMQPGQYQMQPPQMMMGAGASGWASL